MRKGVTISSRLASRVGIASATAIYALCTVAGPAAATAGTVTIYNLPTFRGGTYGVTAGPDGNVWYTEENGSAVGKISPDGSTTVDYPVTYGDPRFITTGADGNLWFTEQGTGGAIGRMTPGGTLTEFPLPNKFNKPFAIAAGPDGNLWFTEDASVIGRVTLSGQITEFPIPSRQALPDAIAVGPDGAMWFTEGGVDRIGRISTQGHVKEFNLPRDSFPSGIVTGPDGKLWITMQSGPPGKVARVDVQGSKLKLTTFPLDDPYATPYRITNGPDGNLWFVDVGAAGLQGAIGRITPAGVITMFDNPGPINKSLIDITAGPGDGKVWFGLYWSTQIANITVN